MLQLRDSPVISEEVRDRDRIIPAETVPAGTKGRREKVDERRWSDFWNSTGLDNRNRAVQLQTCFSLQEKERMYYSDSGQNYMYRMPYHDDNYMYEDDRMYARRRRADGTFYSDGMNG